MDIETTEPTQFPRKHGTAERWNHCACPECLAGLRGGDVPGLAWTADPPAWAPYVGSVIVVDRGTEIHLSIDMRAKYLEPALAEVDGNTIRLTFFTIGNSTVIWPEDPGAWTGATLPSVAIDMGRDMSGYEATATGGRYAFHVVALRPVAWLHDGVYVNAAGVLKHKRNRVRKKYE